MRLSRGRSPTNVETSINAVLQLPENWNSYGAASINNDSANNAMQLSLALARISKEPAPRVSASADGNVVLCWYRDNVSLEIEAMPNGIFDYLSLDELIDENDDAGVLSISNMTDFVSDWLDESD